jgi:hypothetical protein
LLQIEMAATNGNSRKNAADGEASTIAGGVDGGGEVAVRWRMRGRGAMAAVRSRCVVDAEAEGRSRSDVRNQSRRAWG